MHDEFKKFHAKLDSIDKSLNSMDKTLVKQQVILDEHIRRTAILENEIMPIKSHVDQVRGIGTFLFYASLMATILAAAIMFFK